MRVHHRNADVWAILTVRVDARRKPRPIVRCLDMPQRLWNKGYLFEAAVGQGKLLVSGSNFKGASRVNDPAGPFLLDALIRYGLGTEFAPVQKLARQAIKSDPGHQ
jgi:hypothetical protein